MTFDLAFSRRIGGFAACLIAVGALAGCSGSHLTPPVTSTVTSVAIACSPATVDVSGSVTCAATVSGTGSYSSVVSWTASAGTISSNGVLTAPAAAGSVSVTATSTEDSAVAGSATVTVQAAAPTITSVAVTCAPATVALGGTSQCTAAVKGTGSYSSAVNWTATAGKISASGVLTAPAAAGTVTVTATSTEDAAKAGSATVKVQASAPTIASVAVACSPATVSVGGSTQCTATVTGTGSYSPAVSWTTTAGMMSASGVLTAPAAAGTVTVTATSTEDAAKAGSAAVTVTAQAVPSAHVVMVMEENQSYSTVVDNAAWPNLNNLIGEGALPTNYYADSHPSIGNYFMLTTGQLLTTNDNSTTVWDVDSIARRMLAQGVSFRIYAEGITQGYVGDNTGLYLVRHNPFAKLSDIANNPQVADEVIWPFSQFAADLTNGSLPAFSFILPDVDDDAHSGTPQQADAWLQAQVVTPLTGYPAFEAGGNGTLIVAFDEAQTTDSTRGGGHVSPVFWGPGAKSGYKQASTTVYQHQSMLRTVMDILGLPSPPGAAASAPLMTEFLANP
jgi:hypothetical protein